MSNGKQIAVVMPAYNAEKTLPQTVRELPDAVGIRILVDDASSDGTVHVGEGLGLKVLARRRNYGYDRDQQTRYREALWAGADVPAHQAPPGNELQKKIPAAYESRGPEL